MQLEDWFFLATYKTNLNQSSTKNEKKKKPTYEQRPSDLMKNFEPVNSRMNGSVMSLTRLRKILSPSTVSCEECFPL